MPRNKFAVNPAPQGMNSAANPRLLPANRAQRITNFRADRAGRMRACMKLRDVATLTAVADGISYYYGETVEGDRLLVVANGLLYVGVPVGSSDPTEWHLSAVGAGFEIGKAVRSVAYDTETFFVQEGGIQPLRYDGVGVYQLGITPPSAPTVAPGTPSSGSDNKSGTITYYYSYFDSRFRESDVSIGTSINYASHAGKCGFVLIEWGDDPQVHGAYIYATTSGGTTKYRIGTLLKSAGVTFLEDNFADSTVNTGIQAPSPGQYGIPNPASVIAIHKRHIVLNDVDNSDVLQVNNLDAPTQWASVTTLATDGARISIGTHQGAGINGLTGFGSLLMISTRAELLQLWGDAPTGNSPFQIRRIQGTQGILAPDSFATCNNLVVGLMNDGKVWALSGNEGFPTEPISEEIEPDLRAHTAAELEAAKAAFIDNCYVLAIGERLYFYDLSAGGAWVTAEGLTTDPVSILLVGGGFVDGNSPNLILPGSSGGTASGGGSGGGADNAVDPVGV
jgi:hypothetical protein